MDGHLAVGLISTIPQSSCNFTFLPFISVIRDFESDRLSLGQYYFRFGSTVIIFSLPHIVTVLGRLCLLARDASQQMACDWQRGPGSSAEHNLCW